MSPRVTRLTSPKPTDISLVPAALAVAAAAMAVLSSPPTVCTPSERRIITFSTPARAPAPVAAACPPSMPPERNVADPTGGALSRAATIVVSDGVRAECVVTVVWNSTSAICALVVPIWNWLTTSRAKEMTYGRWEPTEPELSSTSTMSSSLKHLGGVAGGVGGEGGKDGGAGTCKRRQTELGSRATGARRRGVIKSWRQFELGLRVRRCRTSERRRSVRTQLSACSPSLWRTRCPATTP